MASYGRKEYVNSPEFDLDGEKWHIRLFPNGREETDDHASVYVYGPSDSTAKCTINTDWNWFIQTSIKKEWQDGWGRHRAWKFDCVPDGSKRFGGRIYGKIWADLVIYSSHQETRVASVRKSTDISR